MVKLNEYLGSIASSIAEARLVSDLKSLEVAEQFAKHDLLKHFSIPRFKAQNIELTIPVAIGEAIKNGTPNVFIPIENKVTFRDKTIELLKKLVPTVKSTLARKTGSLSEEKKIIEDKKLTDDKKLKQEAKSADVSKPIVDLKAEELKKEIDKEVNKLETNIKLGIESYKELNAYAERVVAIYLKIYPVHSRVKLNIGAIVNSVREGLKKDVKSKPKAEGKLEPKVIVESHKLKELAPENIIQIKMTLNEEGLEWHTAENEDGKLTTKLLPE